MAAQVIVELSGDERRVLAAYRKAEEADRALRESTGKTGDAAKAASTTFASAWVEGGKKAGAAVSSGLAAADAKTNFDRSIAELRKINPEAAKAAAAVRDNMSAADAEVEFDRIILELQKIDPAAAAEAKKLRSRLVGVPKEAETAFSKFSTSAITKVAAIGGAFVGIGEVVGTVNVYLENQIELLESALDKQLKLGTAQQEAAKNLAAFSAVEREQLLQEAVPDIARSTGFSDVSQITLALGTAASKGATPEEARAAVVAAARVERLTPENIDETAAGAISVQRQSGLEDARQAIGLIQTTGTQSAITDAAKIVENLPKALGIVSTVRGQDTEEAARQAAAIFAQVTQGGNDSQGNSSATFTIDLGNRLDKMFGNLETTRIEARSELERLENKKNPLEKDLVRMESLRQVIPELEAQQDPGTLFGRIQALQASPAIASEFVGEGFGEKQFQIVLKEMVDANSQTAKALQASFEVIQASKDFFERQALAQSTLTPQLVIANAVSSANAGIVAQESFDIPAATLKAVRNITEQALDATNQGGFLRSTLNHFDTKGVPVPFAGTFGGIQQGGLAGSNALTEGVSAIDKLSKRIDSLMVGGLDPSEVVQAETLNNAIRSISDLLENQVEGGAFDESTLRRAARSTRSAASGLEDSFVQATVTGAAENQRRQAEILERLAATMERQTAAVEQQTQFLQETATNTRPDAGSPDYDAAYNASLAEQDAR